MGWSLLQILWMLVLIATWGFCLVGGWMFVLEVLQHVRPEPQRIPVQNKEPGGTS